MALFQKPNQNSNQDNNNKDPFMTVSTGIPIGNPKDPNKLLELIAQGILDISLKMGVMLKINVSKIAAMDYAGKKIGRLFDGFTDAELKSKADKCAEMHRQCMADAMEILDEIYDCDSPYERNEKFVQFQEAATAASNMRMMYLTLVKELVRRKEDEIPEEITIVVDYPEPKEE